MSAELPLFAHWEAVLGDLLSRTERFPKRVRPTLSNRIDNVALDVLGRLVEARYSRDRAPVLKATNLDLEKLRVLLRLAHDRGLLDHGGYEHVARGIDRAGRMVGGWTRRQREQEGT